ncbi:MAG: class I SAM-dependent methyltransferase [Acidobacteriota bacterium]
MGGDNTYYDEKLAAERLRRCYEIAPPRVQQYLRAEVAHVLSSVRPHDLVLDLGCGFGRVMPRLAAAGRRVIGIDTSHASLRMAGNLLEHLSNCTLLEMNAVQLAFRDSVFDVVLCVQNGISAFHVDQLALIRESLRVTRAGGTVLFSSYAGGFWEHRLRWFELQSEAGLLGEIDYAKTRDGVIACKDGFRATTVDSRRFMELTSGLAAEVSVEEVDESSLLCRLVKR